MIWILLVINMDGFIIEDPNKNKHNESMTLHFKIKTYKMILQCLPFLFKNDYVVFEKLRASLIRTNEMNKDFI